MAEDRAGLDAPHRAPDEVEIRALGLLDVVEPNVADAVKDHRSHDRGPGTGGVVGVVGSGSGVLEVSSGASLSLSSVSVPPGLLRS